MTGVQSVLFRSFLGPVSSYQMPFEDEVGSMPSLIEMQSAVVTRKLRPHLPDCPGHKVTNLEALDFVRLITDFILNYNLCRTIQISVLVKQSGAALVSSVLIIIVVCCLIHTVLRHFVFILGSCCSYMWCRSYLLICGLETSIFSGCILWL